MTNEELKKKIVKVLKETINWTTDYSIPIGIVYKSELDEIADALIAAGIGDVKTAQEIGASATAMAVLEAAKAERRAEVAGLIAKRACDIVFSQEIDSEEWDEAIFNYKKEKGIREIGITPNILYDYLKEQAEKELAEEKGNG